MRDSKHFTLEEAKKIGELLGIDWSKFDVEQFRMGLDVELEDELTRGKIALAHLNEFPDYFTRLQKMEDKAKEFHNKSNSNSKT